MKKLILFVVFSVCLYASCSKTDNPDSPLTPQEWCRAVSFGYVVNIYEQHSIDNNYRLVIDTKKGRTDTMLTLMEIGEGCYNDCMEANRKY